jgi:hypothetical protein
MQLALTARLEPHVLDWLKSPVAVMEILKGAVPVFPTVICCAALLVPTCWLPKVRLVAESVTTG